MNIQPDMICRIVGTPTNNNKLVRTLFKCTDCGMWECEALQHINGVREIVFFGQVVTVNERVLLNPGENVHLPAENLRPLYDGDDDEEWVVKSRDLTTQV